MVKNDLPRLPWWAAVIAAAVGGLLLDNATPGLAWWWAAFPAIMFIVAACWQQRAGLGMLAGAVAGIAFWGPHISWLTLYLGPVPWLGLCAVMVAWYLVIGLTISLATRGLALIPALTRRAPVLILAQAAAVAGLWVLREQVQGSWPYGGFAWGRIATTQSDGPLAQAVSWTGFAGLTGVLVFVCVLVVAALAALLARRVTSLPARSHRPLQALIGGAVLVVIVLAALPAAQLPQQSTLRVAAVQGNSRSAIFDDRESGDVLQVHIDATKMLLDDLEAAGESVDVIVWPENSGEFDLRENPLGSYQVAQLARRADAPIVVGSVLRDADGSYTNSSIVWQADGPTAGRYDKRYPVPFAEYMPNRDFFHALAPDLVDLVQLEYTPGTRSAVLDIDTAQAGPVRAGVAICFDVIFDQQAVEMVRDGAEVIFAQTNNADFGQTDESAQQLAIAQLRAVETGRTLVNISTVGTSAIIAPNGDSLASLEPFTADAMVAEVPLVAGETPAMRFGSLIASAWGIAGAAGFIAGIAGIIARRRSSRSSG